MKFGYLILVLLLTTVTGKAQADRDLTNEIEQIATSALHEGPVAGLSIGVTQGQKIIALKGYGYSNLELETPATPQTVYHIDSITKNLTAAAVLQLVQKGQINLDDPVEKYVPEIHSVASRATVRNLLNHTSGIPDFTSMGERSKNIEAVPFTSADALQLMQSEKPRFAPGDLWWYDNSGFYLLGMLIEKASGQTYADYMSKVFKPLGMNSTRYCDGRSVIKGRAAGYAASKGKLINADPATWETPFSAGGLCSTVGDLLIWQRALNEGRILAPATLDLMRAPTALNGGIEVDYGMGTRRGDLEGHLLFGHTGNGGGFNNVIEYFPADDLTIVVLMNSESSVSALNIAGRIARTILGIKAALPKEQPLTETEMARFSGTFESAEGPAILFADQNRIRVKFEENGSSLPLTYLGDGTFAAGPDTISKAYARSNHTLGAAIYTDGLFMNAVWIMPAKRPSLFLPQF